MNAAQADIAIRVIHLRPAAKYFFADKPNNTAEGCRVETRFTASGYAPPHAFVDVIEHVSLSCPVDLFQHHNESQFTGESP